MLKILGLATGALTAAGALLALTGVPRVAGVDWHAGDAEISMPVETVSANRIAAVAADAAPATDVATTAAPALAAAGSVATDDPSAAEVADEPVAETAARDVAVDRNVNPSTGETARGERPPVGPGAVTANGPDDNGLAMVESDAATRPDATAADTHDPVADEPGHAAPEPIASTAHIATRDAVTADDAGYEPADTDGTAILSPAESDAGAGDRSTGSYAGNVEFLSPPAAAGGNGGWSPVWAPFRSELSARGFVRRLEMLTDLDYRISRVGPGLYQVAFAHVDAAGRDHGIAAIEKATGLELARGAP